MTVELKSRILQHINQKKQDKGFTLIEILVVIIIIGTLSAIALPSFLSRAAQARASEAKINVGTMNRAQQAYYLENLTFVTDDIVNSSTAIDKLAIGIKNSNYYDYTATTITSVSDNVTNRAQAKSSDLKGLAGGVFASSRLTQAILCEANEKGMDLVASPNNANDCGTGSSKIR